MKTKEEILERLKEHQELRQKYYDAFNKGRFSESAYHNYDHVTTRIDELTWVLQSSIASMRKQNEKP